MRISGVVPRHWEPALDGTLRERALNVIQDIIRTLERTETIESAASELEAHARGPALSLAHGLSGTSVFLHYASTGLHDSAIRDLSASHLRRAEERLRTDKVEFGLHFGFTGVAWAACHIAARSGEPLPTTFFEELDDALLVALGSKAWPFHFDLLNGLVGVLVYAAERWPDPAAKSIAKLALDRLIQFSNETTSGRAWFTPPRLLSPMDREVWPRGQYNLGPAHGQPGIVSILAELVRLGAGDQAQRCLEESVKWLLSQKRLSGLGDSHALFPTAVGKSLLTRSQARVGWCYGDGPIALALISASQAADRSDWGQSGREVAEAAVHCQTTAPDTCLCHGAAGAAHVFRRLYEATGHGPLLDRAREWYGRIVDAHVPGKGLGGYTFSSFHPKSRTKHDVADPSLLNGAAGVGLVLLAGVSSERPDWDRILLLS